MDQAAEPHSTSELPAPIAGESAARWVIRLARRALLVGLLVSVLFHITGLIISSRVFYGMGGTPSKEAGEGPGLALMRGPELGDLMGGSIEVSTPSSGDLASVAQDASPEQPLDVPRDPALAQSDALEGGRAMSGAGNMGAGEGMGEGIGGGGGGGGASFFGVEATGSRFVFIVDVSGSMSVGGKIEALRAQLIKSIQNLVETSTFCVFTFSDDASPLGNSKDWSQAIDERKRWARRTIGGLAASGGTEPINAFRMAFRLRPRPDAIYFMTDGQFDPGVVDEIARLNTAHVPIHCLAFMSPESEPLLRRIASQSKGTYTFISGSRP